MQILFNLFPGGLKKALTMSYDDGQVFDLRLAEIFNKNGIKATFHLNSGTLDTPGFLSRAEVNSSLKGHEISVHTKTHPYLERIPLSMVAGEILEDKKALEEICGYPVRGMSYPFGTYTPQIAEYARCLGMEYSRTIVSTKRFSLPSDYMLWHPTVHHNENIMELWDSFANPRPFEKYMRTLYIWGHSYEFGRDGNWHMIEEFCKTAGAAEDVWFATNIELMDYANAVKSLIVSADMSMLMNNSIRDVWLTIDGEAVCIKSGETYKTV